MVQGKSFGSGLGSVLEQLEPRAHLHDTAADHGHDLLLRAAILGGKPSLVARMDAARRVHQHCQHVRAAQVHANGQSVHAE